MDTQKENILLADCEYDEVSTLAETLCFGSREFTVKSHVANWKRTGKISELRRYGKYFAVALRYFFSRKKYDAIVGWQQFYALIYCFYCAIFHVKKTNTVVALNFTYKEKKGKFSKLYRWFMKKCTMPKYLDYIHVLSVDYADTIHRDFDFPRERIIVTAFGVNDEFENLHALEMPEGFNRAEYALAIGRSNRDYDFLINAWKGIDFPLVIISDTYKSDFDVDNVTVLTNVAGEESYPWIVNCGLMVIPIDDPTICSGDTVLLTAMSLSRRIIVTAPSALAQMYVVNGVNALSVEKDADMFCGLVKSVLFTNEYDELGNRARDSFLKNYSRKSMGKELSLLLNAPSELKVI